jgi:hypothetical protein
MISRRDLLATGVAAGALAMPAETSELQGDSVDLSRLVEELRGIRSALTGTGPASVLQLRASQRAFVKNTSRFPEFIDVGFDVFDSTIDWLVSVQQPVNFNRQAEGRYAITFFLTTIVLRTDFPDNYVGQGYDK